MLCYRKFTIVILFVFTALNTLFTQELPPFKTFLPQTYKAGDQNWDITQDHNNTIYIANNKGLLEYNGANWLLNPSPNQTILRAVEVNGSKIYTGSYMDFGYWQRNAFGLLEYTSLINKLPVKLIEDEEFWGIISLGEWVLFQSFERIYLYNTTSKTFKIINSEVRINKIFKVENTIYFQEIGKGIFKLQNGKAVLAIAEANINGKEIINIYANGDGLLLQTKEQGFYSYKNNSFLKWNITANNTLLNTSIYSSIKLKDGSYVLGTISKGMLQLNQNGNVVLNINQSLGLSNNTVLSAFEDVNGNVWLGLNNGISVVNLQSAFTVYKDDLGELGTVYTSAKTKDYLYLGTNQGLFYRPLNNADKFLFVKGTKGQVWSLDIINNELFCGHDKGTFIIKGNKATQIASVLGTWNVKRIPKHPNLLLQGNYKGLSVLEKRNNTWQLKHRVKGFEISSRHFEFLNQNTLLVNHEYKGVFKLMLNATFSEVVSQEKLPIEKSTNSALTNYNNKVFYLAKQGVFEFNNNKNSFVKDSLLSAVFKNNYISGKVVNDVNHNRLWAFLNNSIVYLEPGNLSNRPKVNSIAIPNNLRKSKTGYENILHLNNNKYLIGNMEGYMIVGLNHLKTQNYQLSLNQVAYNALHKTMLPLDLAGNVVLKNQDRNIKFAYSVANFNQIPPTQYQYRLLGLYNNWSEWSENATILFENLNFGNYTFEARAKIGEQLTTNTISYNFTIEKPLHLKPLAVIGYILGFILLLFLMQYFNTKYYKKQRQKLIKNKERELEIKELAAQKELVELKNQNLKQDVENKNRELGISTMNIIKRNELLNNIKSELIKIKGNPELKPVIKLIDNNLNTTNDWKLFEEAFNNADKNFLKKIKKKHPELTSNDLRLCAYLRLNLSSKEIAPLLNISPRSVEVKRYRLRKKMNLDHNENLTNYILEI